MTNHVYKVIELVGSAPDSIEAAIQNAIAQAGESVRHLRWFEVIETRGHMDNGRIAHYQVTLKLGFAIEASLS
ncbi:dodecin [Rhodoligotrophos defluvii]|uniref:dodecin n=1 Tax=Rhodoligotrophos defluvii TaxID=2561934 RepID=UPI0010C9F7EC|nr:dodecin [Rhodoligotrophos defluvii]